MTLAIAECPRYVQMRPTIVINMKRAPRGWRSNPNYVYIGRPSVWGNPFSDGPHNELVRSYERWAENNAELQERIPELRGKVLVCFCKPKSCHGDYLARKANAHEGVQWPGAE